MDSLDSIIDIREITNLVHQLMPEKEEGKPIATIVQDDKPITTEVPPEWHAPESAVQTAFPSLDEILDEDEAAEPAEPTEPKEPSSLVRTKAADTLSQIRNLGNSPAENTAELSVVPEEPAPAGDSGKDPFEPAQGPLRVRLSHFGKWVREVTQCSRFMVADNQGYSMLAENADDVDPQIIGSALQLMTALASVRGKVQAIGAGGVYMPLQVSEWLCVLDCEAKFGRVCLCLVAPAPLSAEAADELTRALRRTLDPAG